MFDHDTITAAVDLQYRSYRLLRWMSDAITRGFISAGAAHHYATLPAATRAWLDRHYNDIPHAARPELDQLEPFSNLFSSYLETSFDLLEAPGQRLYSPDAHCFCPMCSWLVPLPHLQRKKLTRHDKNRASALGVISVKQLGLDLDRPVTDEVARAIASERANREHVALIAYGHDLLRRLKGVVEGPASLALWRGFAWTPTGAPKPGFELTACAILDAEASLAKVVRAATSLAT